MPTLLIGSGTIGIFPEKGLPSVSYFIELAPFEGRKGVQLRSKDGTLCVSIYGENAGETYRKFVGEADLEALRSLDFDVES